MRLYLVHCGFYDLEISDGLYESHINMFVVAKNFEEAKLKAKSKPVFKNRRMHVDGLQEIVAVEGFRLSLYPDETLDFGDVLVSNRHRDLAPKS